MAQMQPLIYLQNDRIKSSKNRKSTSHLDLQQRLLIF